MSIYALGRQIDAGWLIHLNNFFSSRTTPNRIDVRIDIKESQMSSFSANRKSIAVLILYRREKTVYN
jgi:hypothetical protein